MKEIKAIIQPFMLERVLNALAAIDELPGVTVSSVTGWGKTRAEGASSTVNEGGHRLVKKTKLEIVVPDSLAPRVMKMISTHARTGNVGDGKVFLSEILGAVKIRTGGPAEEAAVEATTPAANDSDETSVE